ncbi:hypothetical protein [Sporomusa sp. KB1]|jgi:hypothetical protein|uniref:hypothetical protein n=1 Tax=Sporomusa sp. KB1 TaxID=943346 RepID=UPI0011A8D8B2|nr:hypothetical protein [Sporomusa sp. KB1]TWH49279.1 hypothetical protein Salpa_5489 [Sporomusa sp. KB1]
MRTQDSIIYLDQLEYQQLQSFLGHGPLTSAKYVFMGREEGLGDAGGNNEESVHKRLRWYNELQDCLGHLRQGNNPKWSDGFFIEKPEATVREVVKSLTMYFQAYAKLVLDSNFTKVKKEISMGMLKKCMVDTLHVSSGNTAMTELYPLPKQGKLLYRVEGESWNEYKRARDSWENNINNRRQLLNHLYNKYSVPVTICYAGVEEGNFIAKNFFDNLKFDFTRCTTGIVPEKLKGKVNPSPKPKDIMLGERNSPLGHQQRVILTPFWGNGQMSYDDINVAMAWAVS